MKLNKMTILSALVCSASMAMSGASCAVPGGEVSDAEKASVRPWMLWPRPEPINLPPLFTEASGGATVEAWEKTRRPEIMRIFESSMYGERPVGRPDGLTFTPLAEDKVMMDGQAIRKQVRIGYTGPLGTGGFNVLAYIPVSARTNPAPAFVLICNRVLDENADPDRKVRTGFFPAEEIVARGYAAIIFKNTELAHDEKIHSLTGGVFAVFGPKERTFRSWGAISAWAWGASRVMDWIETERLFDARHVGVVGHSRGGKTSLWAAATDSRFAMACVNDSGCCGAKLNHASIPMSENIELDNVVNPHWFCSAFRLCDGRDAFLPFDMHQVAACIAPRLLAIGSASRDTPAGPYGEFLTAKLASPAWELYGLKGLEPDPDMKDKLGHKGFPPCGVAIDAGCVSYHLREGGHGLTLEDWNIYMDFADRHGWRD